MTIQSLDRPTAYLCPRIVSVEHHHVYYGGDQSWLLRNSAYKGGCGPVCGANILTVYADKNPQYQPHLNIVIDEKHFIAQDDYLQLLQELYASMHMREIPLLNRIYDKLPRNNKVF